MNTRWKVRTEVPEDHRLTIEIPQHIPAGPATLAVEIESENTGEVKSYITAQEVLDSGIVGMWEGREDISDGTEFVRQLREEEERRRAER